MLKRHRAEFIGWVTPLIGEVQQSPARVDDAPPEDIELIPMGCARLRVSAFPTVSSGPDAPPWIAPPSSF